jgi:uncharacterized protein DUF6629
MCFSATASFTMAGVLVAVGVASIARSESPSARLFAAIPLLFGAQQAAEGIVWLTITDPPSLATLHRLAVMTFLALALVIWPLWAPIALRLHERDRARKKVLTTFIAIGVLVAVVAGNLLHRWQPYAVIAGRSIVYKHATMGIVVPEYVLLLVYAIPTVGSFFVSTVPMVRTIGATLFVSLVLAFLIERQALTSVWCFFAAVLSVLIFVAVTRTSRSSAVLQASPAT